MDLVLSLSFIFTLVFCMPFMAQRVFGKKSTDEKTTKELIENMSAAVLKCSSVEEASAMLSQWAKRCG